MKKLLLIGLTLLSAKAFGILTREDFEKRLHDHELEYAKKLEPFKEKIRNITANPDFIERVKKCWYLKKFIVAEGDIVNPFGHQACIEAEIFEEFKNQEDFDITDLLYLSKINVLLMNQGPQAMQKLN